MLQRGAASIMQSDFSKSGHQFLFIWSEKLGVDVTVEALSLSLKINKSSHLLWPAKDHKYILFKRAFEQLPTVAFEFFVLLVKRIFLDIDCQRTLPGKAQANLYP